MKIKNRILPLLIAAATLLTLLPLAVSAASCSHSFGGTRWADAVHPHEYFYFCQKGCGEKSYIGSYMTKSNCSVCNPSIGTCYHTGSTWTDGSHPHATVCTTCCAVLDYDTVSGCSQCCNHNSGYTYTDPTHGSNGHNKYFVCYSCDYEEYSGRTSYLSTCETCNPPVVSSVSLYAEGPRGSIYSSGILEAVSLPATFTVYADCENCYVTSMYYYDDGYKVTSSGDSISYTAYDYDDFASFTVYVKTNTGVTDSIAVNFTFAKYGEAAIKWEYTGAIIRKITQNGKTVRSGLSTEIEFIWGSDLTDSAYDTVTGLINAYDGKTYILSGSSMIRVYKPSNNATIGYYDTYSDFDALCNVAMWSSSTLNAFETARSMDISYQAPKAVEGTATWQTTSGITLYTQSAAAASGHTYIKPNQSITVTFNASSYSPSGYIYKGMEWSCGSDTGSSTTKTSYSKSYNTSTSPVNVTFLYEKTPTSGSITAYAYDADTNQLITTGTVITCASMSSSSNPAAFTGLSFKGYDITGSAPGYSSAGAYVNLSADNPNQTANLFLIRDSGDVTVYVYDADTNRPISGASISGAASGTTNSSGYCTFSGISFTGSHTFTASKSGYYSDSATATLSKSNPSDTIYIYLEPLPKTGDIYVTVYDAYTYDTISGAYVSGAGTYDYTDYYGDAYFYDISFGSYTFYASADGYYSDSGNASISLSSQSDSIAIYLTPLPTEGDITVYVRNADTNSIISGATVSGGGYSGTTNSSGYVKFTGIPLQTYTFSAVKDGYWDNSASASISVNDTTDTITIYLMPYPTEGDITVYVKDKETGAALSGASVVGGGYSKTTNSSGAATFAGLPLQSYTFTASLSGYTSASGSATISIYDTVESITIYLEKKKADVGIVSEDIDGTVYRGSTIIVSAEIVGDELIDFTPDAPLTVTMTATRNGGSVFDTQTTTAICPAGESNLVWFSVDIPENGYTSANVNFKFTVSTPLDIGDANNANDVSTKSVTTVKLPDRNTPDASFELDAPSDFVGSVYKTKNMTTRSWSVWEWNGGFVKKNYSARIDVSAALTPDETAVWSEYDTTKRQWKTRSGYGLNTEIEATLTGIPASMWTGNAKVNAYYSEFNYSTNADRSDMLDRISESSGTSYTATFNFNPDANSISGGRLHKTPIWYPDGDYSVKYYVYDLWTPAGMLSGYTYATVRIEGSMYDDYYTQRS